MFRRRRTIDNPGSRSHAACVADLEEHAIRRDKRFIVRLVVVLTIGVAVGLFIYAKMTSSEVGNCAASGFREVTTSEPAR